jgi:phage terminase small subunit
MSNYKPLTPRQALFRDEYLKDLNAAAAAKRAGLSPKSAAKLMRSEAVKTAIDDALKARSEATGITAEWVLREAVSLYQRCIQEIKPALHPKSRKQMKDAEGNPLFTFNASVAARALELIGKHTTIGAWAEKVEVTAPGMSVVELLQRGRARVAGTGAPAIIDADGEVIVPEIALQLPAPDATAVALEAGRKRVGKPKGFVHTSGTLIQVRKED